MSPGGFRLVRIQPGRNLFRFYQASVQPTLFGTWSLVREWGRIGQPGRVMTNEHPTEDDARSALDRLRHRKERRGYGDR